MLVNAALGMAEAKGAEVVFWDLAEKPLPLVGEEGCWTHPNVKNSKASSRRAMPFPLISRIPRHDVWSHEEHHGLDV